jgi:hypothetical protein
MRKNWILIVPPILIQVVVPLIFMAVAAFSLLPLIVAYSLTGDTSGLIITTVGGILLLLIGVLLLDTFLTAGWAHMNKRVVADGRTEITDLWIGARKFFPRILGGRILVGVIAGLPVVVGVAAAVASLLTVNVGRLTAPGELTPAAIFSLLAPIIFVLIGILIVVGLVEIILGVFLLTWMQALVMEDVGIVKSIRLSIVFVRKNLATAIGYFVVYGVASMVAGWIASYVWPSFSLSELTDPSVYTNGARLLGLLLRGNNIVSYVISAVLSAFFTLLLFVIYADRMHASQIPASPVEPIGASAPQVMESSTPPRQPVRGARYCVNCGSRLIILAVFCPNCGARQPPLPPE